MMRKKKVLSFRSGFLPFFFILKGIFYKSFVLSESLKELNKVSKKKKKRGAYNAKSKSKYNQETYFGNF